MSATDSEIHGGLLLNIMDINQMEPITFPFTSAGANVRWGNQTVEQGAPKPTTVRPFDFWHSSREAAAQEMFVAERGIGLDGRCVGQNAAEVLRHTMHRTLAMNAGLKREERKDMLEQSTNTVMPTLQTPAFISMEMQSSQPKFLLFSRDIPIHMNVFCDEACMLLVWSNERQIESRMREYYGNRFVVYRMPPIVNSACVINTFFLRKRFNRWKYEMRGDNLRILNALESFIFRRAKQDEEMNMDKVLRTMSDTKLGTNYEERTA